MPTGSHSSFSTRGLRRHLEACPCRKADVVGLGLLPWRAPRECQGFMSVIIRGWLFRQVCLKSVLEGVLVSEGSGAFLTGPCHAS